MEVEDPQERVVLFGPIYSDSPIRSDAILDELGRLVEAAGGKPVARLAQFLRSPCPATFLGSGKVEELKLLCEDFDADLAVFDEELNPAQGRNLEQILGIRVIDRSELILDIFASRAKTHQAKLQVGLAQLQYKLPRLKRMWTHLDRIKSAIGARGPGETQIESDRRLIRTKIQEYREKLKELGEITQRAIQKRSDFKVSLVGYTNTGKSTIMRRLTDPDVYVADQLFATLDTLTRRLKIPNAGHCLLSDTVGFVDKLPHHLVDSFHATLSEAREADLLLHIVDCSDPMLMSHVRTVERVLTEINCNEIPTLVIANKIDREGAQIGLTELRLRHPDLIAMSAHEGTGIEDLLSNIAADMSQQWQNIHVLIPWSLGSLIASMGQHSKVLRELAEDDGMYYHLEVSEDVIRQFKLSTYIVTSRA